MKKYIILIFLIVNMTGPVLIARGQEEANTPEQAYNKAIDFYNQLEYNKAIDKFLNAFNTGNRRLEQWTNYNLGNAASSKGQKVQESNPQEAQQAYKQALEFFRRAIELDPQDKNAKHNYELTALKLEQAKQQQQQQNKDDSKDEQQEQQEEEQQQEPDEPEQDSKDQEQQDKNDAQQEAQPREMTKEQAERLLENFENSEDGAMELRQLNQAAQESDTEKDW